MTAPYIYPAYCVPCTMKAKCLSLPHSVNCEALRRVHPVGNDSRRDDKEDYKPQ